MQIPLCLTKSRSDHQVPNNPSAKLSVPSFSAVNGYVAQRRHSNKLFDSSLINLKSRSDLPT